ncbi:MAG TPA: PilZ domain-containing protein [Planctomycetota bacterium]|nr:PilZ domain-containing protein [Planctomycetota bacterium]
MEPGKQKPHRDARGPYRRPQTKAHRLSISVKTPSGDYAGHFQDLSVGGASALFTINPAVLVVNQLVVLTIGSLTRTNQVTAKARVVYSADALGGRLCGFQFTEPAVLAQQIDSFYARFFNRRKVSRVGMPLDRKITVLLRVAGQEHKSELVDISLEGMQVRTSRANAKLLENANHADFRLQLPGNGQEIAGRAAFLRRTSLTQERTAFGLAFDLAQPDGVLKHIAALRSFIVHRNEEISKWDDSLTKPELPPLPRPKPVEPNWSNEKTPPRRLT